MLDLEFNLQRSRHYQISVLTIFVTSIMVLCLLPMNISLKLLFLFFVMAYGIYLFLYSGLITNQHSIIRLRRTSEGEWVLYTPTKLMQATLDPNTTVTRYVCILCFRLTHPFSLKSCVIFPDTLTPEFYRRLLVLLNA